MMIDNNCLNCPIFTYQFVFTLFRKINWCQIAIYGNEIESKYLQNVIVQETSLPDQFVKVLIYLGINSN